MFHGCSLDRWTGQNSKTSQVSEGGMSIGHLIDIHWTGVLDKKVRQAWSVRVGYAMDVPWMSIGEVDWTRHWNKPGISIGQVGQFQVDRGF